MYQKLVTNPMGLDSINNIIHDCKFEMDQISFDSESSTLKINFSHENKGKRKVIGRFLFFKKYSTPTEKWTLQIGRVREYICIKGGQAGPGSDDFFNVLTYDTKKKDIQISTVIGKRVIIEVSDLEVGIIETDTVIDTKISYSMFF